MRKQDIDKQEPIYFFYVLSKKSKYAKIYLKNMNVVVVFVKSSRNLKYLSIFIVFFYV